MNYSLHTDSIPEELLLSRQSVLIYQIVLCQLSQIQSGYLPFFFLFHQRTYWQEQDLSSGLQTDETQDIPTIKPYLKKNAFRLSVT